jgi:hypothetical protein
VIITVLGANATGRDADRHPRPTSHRKVAWRRSQPRRANTPTAGSPSTKPPDDATCARPACRASVTTGKLTPQLKELPRPPCLATVGSAPTSNAAYSRSSRRKPIPRRGTVQTPAHTLASMAEATITDYVGNGLLTRRRGPLVSNDRRQGTPGARRRAFAQSAPSVRYASRLAPCDTERRCRPARSGGPPTASAATTRQALVSAIEARL